MTHYHLGHKPIPIPRAMNIPDAKVAVDKEWEKLEKWPAWQATRVKNRKEVLEMAHEEGRTVHFVPLVDFCHLKDSELEQQFQQNQGRDVLRGDVVKDDSGLI